MYGSPRERRARANPTSSFAQPSHPGGERFAENMHQKDMRCVPAPGNYSSPSSLGRPQFDSARPWHGGFSFATPGASISEATPKAAAAARHSRRDRVHRRLRNDLEAVAMLAGMLRGRIGRRALTRGLVSLGCFLSEADIDTIFEVYDSGRDGTVDVDEIREGVERSATGLPNGDTPPREGTIDDAAKHQQEQEHGQRTRVRMKKRRGHALNFFKLSADGDQTLSVQDQLKKALSQQHAHVIELFREWDTSADGSISIKEFQKGVRRLGFQGDSQEIDTLFRSWDIDSSGAISLIELRSILKRGGIAKATAYLKHVAADAERDREAQEKNKVTRLATKIQRSLSSKSMSDHANNEGSTSSSLSREHKKLLQKMREQKKKLMGQLIDKNSDGFVTRAELLQAVPDLGVKADKKTLETLFDTMDPHHTGRVRTDDLERAIRFASIGHSKLAKTMNIVLNEDTPVHEQIRDALASNAMRVIDFFREWDVNGDGHISRDEFATALTMLGLNVARETYNEVFNEFDRDGSGDITLREFKSALKKVNQPKEEAKKLEEKINASQQLHSLDELRRDVMRECSRLIIKR